MYAKYVTTWSQMLFKTSTDSFSYVIQLKNTSFVHRLHLFQHL